MSARPLSVWLARLWRLFALVLAAWLLHRSAPRPPAPALSLADAKAFFPAAEKISATAGGALEVSDAWGQPLGVLVTTSPAADGVMGYSGPSNLLVALDTAERLVGLRILDSADTPAHVESLRNRPAFADSLKGWKPASEAAPQPAGTSGSTLTGLAMVEAIAKRFGAAKGPSRFPEPVSLDEVRALFPEAQTLAEERALKDWLRVEAEQGRLLGYVLRTSPAGDAVVGYAGPTECLLAVAPDRQTILQIRVRKSYDTDDYVERVLEDGDYLKSLTRWKVSEWPTLDFAAQKIEGVAGATLTSSAIAESVRERLRQHAAPPVQKAGGLVGMGVKDWALFAVVLGAVALAFLPMRGKEWVRRVWQCVQIAVLGLWLGQLLSLATFVGWARNGLPLEYGAPLLLLAAVALLLPWGARRQWYCHHVCPHGAAQEWLGRLSPRTVAVPASWHRALRVLPAVLLAAAFLCVCAAPRTALSSWEPFDFWLLGTAAIAPAVLALVGLGASLFVPMAYCRYGCPTGALFGFIRTASSLEGFTRRDFAALCVLGVGAWLTGRAPLQAVASNSVTEFRGTGFGTTWCVKTRGVVPDSTPMRDRLAAEVERIESTLSHWRATSETSRFNASTSLEPQPVSVELLRLIEFGRGLGAASQGAYDMTVAPLVNAWGYGPAGAASQGPSEERLREILPAVGWNNIDLDLAGGMLRKKHPAVALDLGSVLQGYAVDRLAAILREAGVREALVEVGGELLASGAWTVAIENPADAAKPLAVVELKDAALATSGLARARRKLEGRPVSHIISPKTGKPVAGGIEMVSVRARTCLEADGWATALIASEPLAAEAIAVQAGLSTWIVDEKGAMRVRP